MARKIHKVQPAPEILPDEELPEVEAQEDPSDEALMALEASAPEGVSFGAAPADEARITIAEVLAADPTKVVFEDAQPRTEAGQVFAAMPAAPEVKFAPAPSTDWAPMTPEQLAFLMGKKPAASPVHAAVAQAMQAKLVSSSAAPAKPKPAPSQPNALSSAEYKFFRGLEDKHLLPKSSRRQSLRQVFKPGEVTPPATVKPGALGKVGTAWSKFCWAVTADGVLIVEKVYERYVAEVMAEMETLAKVSVSEKAPPPPAPKPAPPSLLESLSKTIGLHLN